MHVITSSTLPAGTLYFLVSDHLGSVSVATDASGNVVSSQKFTVWGVVRASSRVMPTDVGFTGQHTDNSDALVFMNARYYDGPLGRFLSADSIVPGAGNPQALNRYSYAYNNPLKYTDPSGHCPQHDDECEELLKQAEEQLGVPLGNSLSAKDIRLLLDIANGLRGQTAKDVFTSLLGAQHNQKEGAENCIGELATLSVCGNHGAGGLPNFYVKTSSQDLDTLADVIQISDGTASYLIEFSGATIFWIDTAVLPGDPSGKAFGIFVAKIGNVVGMPANALTVVRKGPTSLDSFATYASFVDPTGTVNSVTQFLPLVSGWDKYVFRPLSVHFGWTWY